MENRSDQLLKVLRTLHADGTQEAAQAQLKALLGEVSADELARAESQLVDEGIDPKEVQGLCHVHAAVVADQIIQPDPTAVSATPGHPLFIFLRENEGARAFMAEALEPAIASGDVEGIRAALEAMAAYERHWDRKENLFFPYLEKAGITAPPKVMWGVDDEIRACRRAALKALRDGADASHALAQYVSGVYDMMTKEEKILTPMLMPHIQARDWLDIAKATPDYPHVFNDIDGARTADFEAWLAHTDELVAELDRALAVQDAPRAASATEDNPLTEGWIAFPSGRVSLDELVLALNTVPNDLTFIGEDDRVRFFTEGKHMIFKRPRVAIGRDVMYCHPPKAQPVVAQLLADFRSHKKAMETRIFKRGEEVVLVRYYAVYDDEGVYRGTLESTEDVSFLRDYFLNEAKGDDR